MKSFCFKIQLHSPYRTNIAENHSNNVTGNLMLSNLSVMSKGSKPVPSAKAGTNKTSTFFITYLMKERKRKERKREKEREREYKGKKEKKEAIVIFKLNSNMNTSKICRYLAFSSGALLMENCSVSLLVYSQDQRTVLTRKK